VIQPPSIIVHCDWGTAPGKRWMAKAPLRDGQYIAHAPEPVGELSTLIERIEFERGPDVSALVGFDFPIGIPAQYAENANVDAFPPFLLQLGKGKWKHFYEICADAVEISIQRPFYPYNFTPKGSKSPRHLVEKLKLSETSSLLRTCERPQSGRPAAGSLFWTLGPKAPGRGTRIGWRDVIAPALSDQKIQLWPFHGKLAGLLKPGATAIAETYPTQYYARIFGSLSGSKTDRAVRANAARKILELAENHAEVLKLNEDLRYEIESGFNDGDDAFDAVIGLIGMIDALQNYNHTLEPKSPTIRNIEGWILGQPIL
jgi:hypothetical protein